jgi:hypothetical protein
VLEMAIMELFKCKSMSELVHNIMINVGEHLMKLTEEKLKQMILDEIKSNLSPDDTAQLHADIELVRELSAEIDRLRDERYKVSGDKRLVVVGRKRTPELKEVDEQLAQVNNQISAIAKKYNIRHYYDSPGNYDLINLMRKKFRRKNI